MMLLTKTDHNTENGKDCRMPCEATYTGTGKIKYPPKDKMNPYAPYRLTPELEAKLDAMTFEVRRAWWENDYPEYVATLPVADLLILANGTQDIRYTARPLLIQRMREAGLIAVDDFTCMTPCCGQHHKWNEAQSGIAHIKHSPCPFGFSVVEGKSVCDCKRKFDTPNEAREHQRKIGNCLHYRRERQALFCVICEHQCETKKDLEAHKQSKSHIKKENPIKLICDVCEVSCRTKKEYDRHCEGKLHKFRTDPATRPNLTCSACKITCSSQRKYEAHLLTAKHLKKTTSVNVAVDTNGPD
jgi:hypothetical protein